MWGLEQKSVNENPNLVEIIQKKTLGPLHKDLGVLHIFGEICSIK
jgi:hypothetical protein